MVLFGRASGLVDPVDPRRPQRASLFLTGPALVDYTRSRDELLWRAQEILSCVASGELRVHIHGIIPWQMPPRRSGPWKADRRRANCFSFPWYRYPPLKEKCIQSLRLCQRPPQLHPIAAKLRVTTPPEKIIPGRFHLRLVKADARSGRTRSPDT